MFLWDPLGPNEGMDCQTEQIHVKRQLKLCIKDLHPQTDTLCYKIQNPGLKEELCEQDRVNIV